MPETPTWALSGAETVARDDRVLWPSSIPSAITSVSAITRTDRCSYSWSRPD